VLEPLIPCIDIDSEQHFLTNNFPTKGCYSSPKLSPILPSSTICLSNYQKRSKPIHLTFVVGSRFRKSLITSSQVRALASPTDNLILSASRDTTAISWQRSPSDSQFKPDIVLRAGSRYVNSVAFISPGPDSPKGMSSV
jgi:hypothetical protein